MARFSLACVVVLTTMACSQPKVVLGEGDRVFAANQYTQVQARWSRRGEMYKDFLSRMFAYGTYKSWVFRQAQVVYRAETERLPAIDVARLREQERREAVRGHDFFLAVHTHEWSWNHLERTSDDALWRLRLINDMGDSVAPTKIQRIGVRNGRYTPLYPSYEDFYVGYLVHFPRLTERGREILRQGIGRFTVRISGPQAGVALTGDVGP